MASNNDNVLHSVTVEDLMGYWKLDGIEIDNFQLPIQKDIKKTPEEYYNQIQPQPSFLQSKYDTNILKDKINFITENLRKIGVLFYCMPWDKRSLYSDHSETMGYYCNKIYNEIIGDEYSNGFIYTSQYEIFRAGLNGKLYIHYDIKDGMKNKINQVLTEAFPGRTVGIVNKDVAIIIYIKEKELSHIRDSHLMYISIIFNLPRRKTLSGFISDDYSYIITKMIQQQIGKDIIYKRGNFYLLGNELTIFYHIFDDKEEEFKKLAKITAKNILNDKLSIIKKIVVLNN